MGTWLKKRTVSYNNENIIPTVTRIAIREQRKNPISINKDALAAKALAIMNSRKITSLCVHNGKNKQKTIGLSLIHI